jgi:hypothetical protein
MLPSPGGLEHGSRTKGEIERARDIGNNERSIGKNMQTGHFYWGIAVGGGGIFTGEPGGSHLQGSRGGGGEWGVVEEQQ